MKTTPTRENQNDDINHDNDDHHNRQLLHCNCPRHGERGMAIKCMFCCNPSLYFINDGAIYCCHKCRERYAQIIKEQSFPACNGNCDFSPHPPNGERIVTGYCVLCE